MGGARATLVPPSTPALAAYLKQRDVTPGAVDLADREDVVRVRRDQADEMNRCAGRSRSSPRGER